MNAVTVGTSSGVLIPNGVGWKLLAPELPMSDMVYEVTDDTLPHWAEVFGTCVKQVSSQLVLKGLL